MQISGHKTRRYNIVSEGNLREAARKLGNCLHDIEDCF